MLSIHWVVLYDDRIVILDILRTNSLFKQKLQYKKTVTERNMYQINKKYLNSSIGRQIRKLTKTMNIYKIS